MYIYNYTISTIIFVVVSVCLICDVSMLQLFILAGWILSW